MNNKLLQEKYQLINEDGPDPRDKEFQIIIGIIVEFLEDRGVNIASLDTADKFVETFHREAVKVYGGRHVGSPWRYTRYGRNESVEESDILGRLLIMHGYGIQQSEAEERKWFSIINCMLDYKIALLGRAWRMWKERFDSLHKDNPGVPGDF